MKKENNFIDFLKQYNIDASIITGVKDFIEDTKQTHL